VDFDDFTEETLSKQPLIIICAATHYEGDPCDNMKKFYKWLRETRKNKENHGKLLKGVRYTVFGLGDSSYE
jgi:NADPH-ferrihemoprotein reductase